MIFKNINIALGLLTPKNKFIFKAFIFLMIITMLFEFMSVASLLPLLNIFLDHKINFLSFDLINLFNFSYLTSKNQTLILLAAIFIIFFLKNIYLAIYYYYEGKFIYELRSEIASKLFSNYLQKNYSSFLENNPSILLTRISQQAPICGVCIMSILSLITNFAIIFAISIFLLIVATKATMIVLFLSIFFSSIYFFFTKKIIYRNSLWLKNSEEKKVNIIQESFGAIKEIILYDVKDKFLKLFNKSNNLIATIGHKLNFVNRFPKIFFELVIIAIICFIILFFIINDYEKKEISLIIGIFIVSFLRILPSANAILQSIQAIKMSIPSVESVSRDLNLSSNIHINKKNLKFINQIKFSNVSYKYPNSDSKILKDINLTIKKNDIICVQGDSGSGKTTFVDLLTGLIKPTTGKILCDKKNIADFSYSWKKKISYVPQNLYLLDDTIRNNIYFSKKNIDLVGYEDIKNQTFLKFLNQKLLSKLDVRVGHNGSKISGGEKQRIGIARAMFKNPEVLIFDESTNALDKKNEETIFNNLKKIKKNKTIIFITHKAIKSKYFNKIIKIENNKVRLLKNL